MLKKLITLAVRRARVAGLVDEDEDTPRYPPFMKGLPAKSVDALLETQKDLLRRLRQAVGVPPEEYEAVYMALIRRFTAYVHLLPASEGHHHRGSGGLLRHSLEVAVLATQLADRVMWAVGEPPSRRRELEPRWCCAVFVAALCHDAGKPFSDLKVTDQSGEHEWDPMEDDLAQWCERIGTRRYFLQWRSDRHRRHESLTPMVLPRLIPKATRQYIRAAGPEIYQQMLRALGSRDFVAGDQEHNRIYTIVREADKQSTEKDISDPTRAGVPGALGVPLERYIVDAMRRMVQERHWKWNKPGSRVWILEDDAFIVWPAGAEDIVKLLARDKAPGIPRHPDTLADVLLERGLATHFERDANKLRTWPIQPQAINEKRPGVVLHALRLTHEVNLFDLPPASVEGVVGEALIETLNNASLPANEHATDADTVAEQNQPQAAMSTTEDKPLDPPASLQENERSLSLQQNNPGARPELDITPSNTNEGSHFPLAPKAPAPDPKPSEPNTPLHENEGEPNQEAKSPPASPRTAPKAKPKSKPGTEAGTDSDGDDAAQAQAWFASAGHAGALVAGLAEDFRDGRKSWAKQGVEMSDGKVAIAHPGGWSGLGVAAKDLLPMLSEAGWVDIDPFQPMRRVREVDGFRESKGEARQSALVLNQEVSRHFITIAKSAKALAPQVGKANKQQKADKQPPQTKPATRPAQTASTETLSRAEVIAAIYEIIDLGSTGLPHRIDGESIYIPVSEATTVLAHHLRISRHKATGALEQVKSREAKGEIVIPAPGKNDKM